MAHTILVVEDTAMLRKMYVDRLAGDGHRVLQAADGAEALSILKADTPDLILLDLIMPKMSGLEVLDLVKRDPRLRDIPVLILSNLGQEEDMARGMELGAVDYLIKNDVRPMDISARITEILLEEDCARPVHEKAFVPGVRTQYRLYLRDYEGDITRFVADAELPRRFWCPACEVELALELLQKPDARGWYDAHLVCPRCEREF